MHIQSLRVYSISLPIHCLHPAMMHSHAPKSTHKCSIHVYIAEIISAYNRKKGDKISSYPPCSSPQLIFLIISSLVLLCVTHSHHKTSASREALFVNISIYCLLKGHKLHILHSSWTNSFNSARKRADFQHTRLDKRITNSARQADRGS